MNIYQPGSRDVCVRIQYSMCVFFHYRIQWVDVCKVSRLTVATSPSESFSLSLSGCVSAPSQVSEVIKERVQEHSIQLSWQEPEQPNGVITEYEIKYYEKVSVLKSDRERENERKQR